MITVLSSFRSDLMISGVFSNLADCDSVDGWCEGTSMARGWVKVLSVQVGGVGLPPSSVWVE